MGYNPEVSSEEFAIDLTGVGNGKSKSYTIPEGDYTVILTDLEKGISSNNNPQWIWTFEVGNGPHVGFSLKMWTATTAAATWKIGQVLEALELASPGEVVKFSKDDAIGRRCVAEVIDSEYNSTTRSKIETLMPHPEGSKGDGDEIPF